jgi:valyl-tRNA synthetase
MTAKTAPRANQKAKTHADTLSDTSPQQPAIKMSQRLAKRYNPATAEPRLQAAWAEAGVLEFRADLDAPVYSIDTPPATVSGHLHLGHCYSYSHTDFIARFWRMNGYNVFYPMGFDDNGLPTERLVERWEGVRATEIGRQAFIHRCLEVSQKAEADYRGLWQRLGLSIDWRYSYRTIDELSRRAAQLSFLELYRKGLAYRREAPAIWCPECGTAIAQAELADLERKSVFYTLAFKLENSETLEIATTRPELLPGCVAIFVHPDDARFRHLVGRQARVPYFDHEVPVLEDRDADPEKGTGVVMCCTFGDTADVAWWYTHVLPLRLAIDRTGHLTGLAKEFAGLPVAEARQRIAGALDACGLLLDQRAVDQSIRIHERCDTPVEYIIAQQWFIRVLDHKERLLDAGARVNWHPQHMHARYREWVKNLDWDWCISRQRYYGVPFPIWYCEKCGSVMTADDGQLPIDPSERGPDRACDCGGTSFRPEEDVMDTWATSSLTPQIAGQRLSNPALYEKVFPYALRPQAHEIIRTWAFYTIVKSQYHFDTLPWSNAAISGWGVAPMGEGKISKSRGGGPMPPLEMIERYSADAVRYWAASTGPGKDAIIDEEKIKMGAKLVTKLWNVARFSQRFLAEGKSLEADGEHPALSPADRWILASTQRVIVRATESLLKYDYAAAKSEAEVFFWRDVADNYLEMAKVRLYSDGAETQEGARYTLRHVLLATLKLFAPFIPHVTEEIYLGLFSALDDKGAESIHVSRWPAPDPRFESEAMQAFGDTLVTIATTVRRYKSENSLPLGTEITVLQLATTDADQANLLQAASLDIKSVTRARNIQVVPSLGCDLKVIHSEGGLGVALSPT